MEAARAHGSFSYGLRYYADGVGYEHDRRVYLFGDGRTPSGQGTYDPPRSDSGPFVRADFGDRDRLSWPAGACAIAQDVTLVPWGGRFAMWIVDGRLSIVDATRDRVVGLVVRELGASVRRCLAYAGRLWLVAGETLAWFELAALEALFDRAPGALAIRVTELYPLRRADRREPARVVASSRSGVRVHTTVGPPVAIELPGVHALAVGTEVTLCDEVVPYRYRSVEVAGRPRQDVDHVPAETTIAGELVHEPAIDPARPLVAAVETSREAELERLFHALADDPDDPATPEVLVDLLEEVGEPYAPLFARLLAGDEDDGVRRDALGSLASYFARVGYTRGLPREATLAGSAPRDGAFGDAVAADRRLGLFHTLRLGDGDYQIYARLVGSPRAIGLRHVDGSRHNILAALIAAKRTSLRRLSNLKFANRDVLAALADPTFDSVREVDTETTVDHVEKLFEFIARDELGFFGRVPRHLFLRERSGADDFLLGALYAKWPRMRVPVTAVTVAGETLTR